MSDGALSKAAEYASPPAKHCVSSTVTFNWLIVRDLATKDTEDFALRSRLDYLRPSFFATCLRCPLILLNERAPGFALQSSQVGLILKG